MSNCHRLTDDAAFVDCLALEPQDRWTPQDIVRLLTIAVRATHVPAQGYVNCDSSVLQMARDVITSYEREEPYANGRCATTTEVILAREILKLAASRLYVNCEAEMTKDKIRDAWLREEMYLHAEKDDTLTPAIMALLEAVFARGCLAAQRYASERTWDK